MLKLNWLVTMFGVACVIMLIGIAWNHQYNAGFGAMHGTVNSGEIISIAEIETDAGGSERRANMESDHTHLAEEIRDEGEITEGEIVVIATIRRVQVPVVFSGGHETNPVDRGRPVVLIASALGVTPKVFRDAFSRVRPAPGGTRPTRERERMNKDVLMRALGRHGITNERLDAVSNYYRYQPGRGRLWPTEPARAFALVENDVVTGFEIVDGGSGYSSVPEVRVSGIEGVWAIANVAYTTQSDTNGSITGIRLRNWVVFP